MGEADAGAAGRPALIGLDWGTSSLRAMLLDARGAVLSVEASNEGILNVPGRDFDAVFEAKVGPWLDARGDLPILASGMITSRNGWVETPYLPLPAGLAELAGALVPHRTARGRTLRFVTGLVEETPEGPDVMRGEETEIVGRLAATGADEGAFVLPGTHAKWARVEGGRIVAFRTYMTGEIYGALVGHTILGRLVEPGAPSTGAFERGARASLSSASGPGGLLSTLFSARTLPLTGRMPGREVADYLSGLLVGAEVADGLSRNGTGPIVVVGRGDLAARYRAALALAGRDAAVAEPGAAARGLAAIARAAGLLRTETDR